jgi:FkbM family methyltransferase
MLSTNKKIFLARILSKSIIFFRKFLFKYTTEVICSRMGFMWSLNLREGIDLAIYLLGGFEVKTLHAYKRLIKEGDIVIDIGANIGAHTIPFSNLVGDTGKVFAIEPTAYAFLKLLKNIFLNSNLSPRISPHQLMLMADNNLRLPKFVYSSWPLESARDLHKELKARLMTTEGASSCTLDSFVLKAGINHVDFIKLDVDGNEFDVLAGAKSLLLNSKPKIILELAPYCFGSNQKKFDSLIEVLWSMGYRLSNISNGKELPPNIELIKKIIPKSGGINVLAIADSK